MKIGILGGIGVEATGYFYLSLIQRLQSRGLIQSNTDYPNLIINSLPAPELHLEEHDTPEVLKPYIDGIRDLSKSDPDFIVMICNTIHIYLDTIKLESGFHRFLSLRDIVRDALRELNPQKICILGTGLTISRGLYEFPEYAYISLSPDEQSELCQVVTEFNSKGSAPEHLKAYKHRLLDIIMQKKHQGAEMFLLACTEVSEILSGENITAMDTLELLIDGVFQRIHHNTLNE